MFLILSFYEIVAKNSCKVERFFRKFDRKILFIWILSYTENAAK